MYFTRSICKKLTKMYCFMFSILTIAAYFAHHCSFAVGTGDLRLWFWRTLRDDSISRNLFCHRPRRVTSRHQICYYYDVIKYFIIYCYCPTR